MSPTLNDLGLKFGTDKASTGHGYLDVYEYYLKDFVKSSFTLLELGVGPTENMGKSLLMWSEFFPSARVVGVDIREDAKTIENERISVEIGDCGNVNFLRKLAQKYSPTIIIDDASHKWSHQILAFEQLFPALTSGGIFISEDLNTSYSPLKEHPFYIDHYEDAASYFAKLMLVTIGKQKMHSSYSTDKPSVIMSKLAEQISFISATKHAVIIKKDP